MCYKIKMMKAVLMVIAVAAVAAAAAGDDFQASEKAWREKRQSRLASDSGWLTLVGLDWLQPGENPFGSDPSSAVPLPAGKAPARAGVLVLDGGKVRLVPDPAAGLTIDGKPAPTKVLADDAADKPDVVKLGTLSFYVVRRGDRVGVRVKDPDSPVRKNFKGLDYFPADPRWVVTGTFEPYPSPREVAVPTVLGTTDTMLAPGLVKFSIGGREMSLEPVIEDPSDPSLWFIFKDATSAKETYGGGRFLYAPMPKDGKVDVDFNQAYNPPCAFTPYATCPLPPQRNWLPIRVEAGEKAYAGGHH